MKRIIESRLQINPTTQNRPERLRGDRNGACHVVDRFGVVLTPSEARDIYPSALGALRRHAERAASEFGVYAPTRDADRRAA
jgi:hypothetical protein